jgi:RNA polymerase sigma-70 factor (ECF subfamily)
MRADSDAARRRRFEAEALPHLDALYRTALRLLRDHGAAEDLVQETYLRAYRAFDRYTPGTNCRAWLFRILLNAGLNARRRAARRPAPVGFEGVEPVLAAAEPGAEPLGADLAAFAGLVDDEVRAALEALPAPFREVLLLSVEGLPYKEIAAALGIPVGTVMSRLFRARRLLRSALGDYARQRGLVRDASRRGEGRS